MYKYLETLIVIKSPHYSMLIVLYEYGVPVRNFYFINIYIENQLTRECATVSLNPQFISV